MSVSETMIETNGFSQKDGLLPGLFRTVSALVFRPGRFYAELPGDQGYMPPLVFLFACCLLYSGLASIFMVEQKALFTLIVFINAFLTPFITAFVLYIVGILLCRHTFTYRILFAISAYAGVTLTFAWIPGLGWVTGIWKFYLIGLGMAKAGRLSGLRVLACLALAASVLLLLIQFLQPVLGQ